MRDHVMRRRIVFTFLLVVWLLGVGHVTNAKGQSADTTLPEIRITSPTDGSIVSGKVQIHFYAFDLGGFDRYELYIDGVLKQTLLPTAKNPYFIWSAGRNSVGNHTLLLKGYDRAGNVGVSAPVSVTVGS